MEGTPFTFDEPIISNEELEEYIRDAEMLQLARREQQIQATQNSVATRPLNTAQVTTVSDTDIRPSAPFRYAQTQGEVMYRRISTLMVLAIIMMLIGGVFNLGNKFLDNQSQNIEGQNQVNQQAAQNENKLSDNNVTLALYNNVTDKNASPIVAVKDADTRKILAEAELSRARADEKNADANYANAMANLARENNKPHLGYTQQIAEVVEKLAEVVEKGGKVATDVVPAVVPTAAGLKIATLFLDFVKFAYSGGNVEGTASPGMDTIGSGSKDGNAGSAARSWWSWGDGLNRFSIQGRESSFIDAANKLQRGSEELTELELEAALWAASIAKEGFAKYDAPWWLINRYGPVKTWQDLFNIVNENAERWRTSPNSVNGHYDLGPTVQMFDHHPRDLLRQIGIEPEGTIAPSPKPPIKPTETIKE